MRTLGPFLIALLLAAPLAGQTEFTLRFDGNGDETGVTGNGVTDFSLFGSSWTDGATVTFGVPKLYASGAFSFVPQEDPAQVLFTDELVSSATFFFVHNNQAPGDTPGTARAYDVDDNENEIASADSLLATAFGDPGNFVTLDAVADIRRIEFSGGIVDSFTFTTSGVAAPAPVTPIVLGDKVRGTLAAGSEHEFPFEAAAGSKLNVRVTRKGKSGFQPGLRLIGPGEVELFAADATALSPKAAAIKKYVILETGLYRLEVVGLADSSGEYRMKTKAKPAKIPPQVVAVPPEGAASAPVLVGATANSEIKKLTFKMAKAKGDFAEIGGQPNDLLPTIEQILAPVLEGSLDLTGLVTTSPNGRKVILKGLVLPTVGDDSLIFGSAEGSVGFGRLKLKVKPPKGKTVHDVP